jgi:hypothetical protein
MSNKYQVCPICNGSGKITPIDPKKKKCKECSKCRVCNGHGLIKIPNK